MVASGKSSNRKREYERGYFTKGGHGRNALQGELDRKAEERRAEQKPPEEDHE